MSEPMVGFDASGWREDGEVAPGVWVWYTPEGDGVGLYTFGLPPDLPRASTWEEFRARSEQDAGGPRVDFDVVDVDDRSVLKQILKFPQQPSGMTYLGSLTIPFIDCSFVVKVQCEERGMTGQREAVLLDQLLAEGRVHVGPDGIGGAWEPDNFQYDSQFPSHPLSRARRVLAQIEQSLVLDSTLRTKPAYPLPS